MNYKQLHISIKYLKHIFVYATLFVSMDNWADDLSSNSPLAISGFISVIGGKIFNGQLDDHYVGSKNIGGTSCPCYIADWANSGVYNKTFSLTPESHAGIQADYSATTNLYFSGQLVTRGTDIPPNVQWAYLGYHFNDEWEIHIGRQRIPIYYYSTFQDVGVAFPWITPPPELYGWEANNYNGASLRYNTNINGTNINASAFVGSEKVNNSAYYQLFLSGDTVVTWKNIIGGDVKITNGPLILRADYLQTIAKDVNTDNFVNSTANLKMYGLAANLDFNSWFILSELTQLSRDFSQPNYTIRAPAYTLGAGIRYANWTPFLNFASYTEHTDNALLYQPQSYRRVSLTLRYDLDQSSAIKAQLDHNVDVTENLGGTVNLYRLSYDRVF